MKKFIKGLFIFTGVCVFFIILGVVFAAIADNGSEVTTTETTQEQPAEKQEPKKEEPKKEVAGISKAEFEKIQTGMTYEEVVKIIGTEGELMSEVGEKGTEYYTVMYSWDGEKGFGANANATFQGGKMMSKAQFGLEN
jgi:hypothetical protein